MYFHPWFHGSIASKYVESLLAKNGCFLVRRSPESPSNYYVCVKWSGRCKEIPILSSKRTSLGNGFSTLYSLENYAFTSITDLITYYMKNQLPIDVSSGAVLFTPVPSRNQSSLCDALFSRTSFRCENVEEGTPSDNFQEKNVSTEKLSSTNYLNLPQNGASVNARSLCDLSSVNFVDFYIKNFEFNDPSPNAVVSTNDVSINAAPDPKSATSTTNVEDTNRKVNRKDIRYLKMSDRSPLTPFNRSLVNLSDAPVADLSHTRPTSYKMTAGAERKPSRTSDYCYSPFDFSHNFSSSSVASLPSFCDTYADIKPPLSACMFNNEVTAFATLPCRLTESKSSLCSSSYLAKPPLPSARFQPDTLPTRQTDALCRGFVNYNLTDDGNVDSELFRKLIDDTNDLIPFECSRFWDTVASLIFNDKICPVQLANHLVMETVRLLLLLWGDLSRSHVSSSLPQNGYALMLWPAANGFREDLLTRDRFLTLFVISSIISQPTNQKRASLLSTWLQTTACLIANYRDNFTANALLNAIFSPQILSLVHVWQLAKEMHAEKIDDILLRSLQENLISLDQCPLSNKAIEIHAAPFSNITHCIPNLVPLLSLLCRCGKRNSREECARPISGSLSDFLSSVDNSKCARISPPVQSVNTMSYLDTARRLFYTADARRRRSSSNCLWIEYLSTRDFEPDPLLQRLFRTETLLLVFAGAVKLDRGDQLPLLHANFLSVLSHRATQLTSE